jgi:cytoskeleton protein RodZ
MTEWVEQTGTPGAGDGPGKTLAAAREEMGWTVEQVADQLKLAVRQVVALEAGDYASLPGPAVVRGFIRAYAKVVKLDAVPLVALIPLDTPAASDATGTTVHRNKPASFSEVRFPTNGKRSKLPLGWIALLVLVAAGAGLAWQFQLIPAALMRGGASAPAAAGSQASVTVLQAPVSAKPADAPIETTLVKPGQELPPVVTNSVPLISVPPQTAQSGTPPAPLPATGATPAGVAPAPAAAAAPATATAAAPAAANVLVLAASGDSWIEVRPLKGKPLLSKLARAGSTETLTLDQPVTLIVGKPSVVNVTLRGAPVALPPVAGSTVSRVSLN